MKCECGHEQDLHDEVGCQDGYLDEGEWWTCSCEMFDPADPVEGVDPDGLGDTDE